MPGDGQAGGTKGGGKKDPTVSSNITTTSSISTAPSSKPTQHETGNSPATITTALSSNTTANFTQAVDANLDVVLYCTIDPTFCRKVGNALGAAAYKLVQVIGLKSKVVIEASYYSFCDNNCANSTLGWAAPSSQFTLPNVGGVDPNYLYPQALAKQLAPYNNSNTWSAEDISIELNHDAYMSVVDIDSAYSNGWNGTGIPPGGHFWFQGDPEIQSDQVDMEYVILHELLHGLGFISSWGAFFYDTASPYHLLIEDMFSPQQLQLITPTPNAYTDTSTGATFISGFQPTMIFDKFLMAYDPDYVEIDTPHSLSELVVDVQQFCVKNNDAFIINFVRTFNQANESNVPRYLWHIVNTNQTLFFKFPSLNKYNQIYNNHSYLSANYNNLTMLTYGSGNIINSTEETSTNFRPGVSISHLDDMYIDTPDFLLRTTPILGYTLQDIIDSAYADVPDIMYEQQINATTKVSVAYKSAIGPGILHVLDTMGYSTVLANSNYSVTSTDEIKQRVICGPSHNSGDQTTINAVESGALQIQSSVLLLTVCIIACFIDFL